MLTLFVTIVIYHFFLRNQINKALAQTESLLARASIGCAWFLVALLFLFGLNQSLRAFSDNNYVNELASNGPYQFFAAFRNNEIDYTAFYQTLPDKQASALLKTNVLEKNTVTTKSGALYSISRRVSSEAAEKPLNIVLIMVESLSAKYLGSFGNEKT